MVLWGRARIGLVSLLLSWGCTGMPGAGTPTPPGNGPRLDVTVVVPPASAPDPFDQLTFYRVTVLAGGTVVTTADIPLGAPLEVDGLEPAAQVRLVLEGHNASGIVSRGRTRVFDLTASQVQQAYLYFAQVNTFNDVNGPAAIRTGAYISKLSDDKVIIGGGNVAGTASTTVELYDPDTDTIKALNDAPTAHAHAVAVALDDVDTIFIAGGVDDADLPTGNAMVFEYDSTSDSGSWTAATPMTDRRANAAAASLGNNQVLVAGGFDGTGILDTSEVFTWDGLAGSWEDAPDMNNQREGPLAFPVGPGQALVGMGSEGPDQYNRDLRLYTYFPASAGQPAGDYDFVHLLGESRAFTGFAALGDNQFLLFGGLGNNDEPVEDVDLVEYIPSIEDVVAFSGSNLPSPRIVGGTHVMEDGRVLLIGGDEGPLGAPAPINEALTYDPATMQFTDLGALPGVTAGAVVAALPDGTLLCVLDGQVKRYNP